MQQGDGVAGWGKVRHHFLRPPLPRNCSKASPRLPAALEPCSAQTSASEIASDVQPLGAKCKVQNGKWEMRNANTYLCLPFHYLPLPLQLLSVPFRKAGILEGVDDDRRKNPDSHRRGNLGELGWQ